MRIGLAVVLALSLTPAPLGTAAAQSPERAARVGYLYPTLLADLVRLKVDVLVTQSGEATKAAQAATKTIPIVMSMVMDPVASGILPRGDRQGLRGDDQAASGGASDFPGRVIRNSTKTDSRTRGEEPPPNDTRGDAGLRGGGRFHGL